MHPRLQLSQVHHQHLGPHPGLPAEDRLRLTLLRSDTLKVPQTARLSPCSEKARLEVLMSLTPPRIITRTPISSRGRLLLYPTLRIVPSQ